MKDYNEFAHFIAVARSGSFSEAAKKLGLQKSTLSRKISALEDRIGQTLLTRTTRKTSLTHAGQNFLDRISNVFEEIDAAENFLGQTNSKPCGTIRITAPVVLGMAMLPKIVSEFSKLYPEIQMDLMFDDRIVDLVGERFDLAIRTGDLKDSTLKAKKVGVTEFLLYASPAYLAKHSPLRSPKDLMKSHSCITYFPGGEEFVWELFNSGKKFKLKNAGRIKTNTLVMAKELAKEGAGIALIPAFICQDELLSGELTRVLPDWHGERSKHWIVYPAQKHLSPEMKLFVPFLSERL